MDVTLYIRAGFRIGFLLFLLSAAWQDLRKKSIRASTFYIWGMMGLMFRGIQILYRLQQMVCEETGKSLLIRLKSYSKDHDIRIRIMVECRNCNDFFEGICKKSLRWCSGRQKRSKRLLKIRWRRIVKLKIQTIRRCVKSDRKMDINRWDSR